jgi:iron complex outermembrane receptor protein
MRLSIWGASAIALATAYSQGALAQEAPQQTADEGETIIVTGTRQSGVTAEKSSTPIEVVGAENMASTGVPDLSQELTRLVPSFSTQQYGGDTAALTSQAQLRGLSPNDVLVLVNGKRRDASANITADPGPTQGSNAVDLNLIPAAAIDHIEVLTDGAAAQYGSDAIAGVINIILKSADHGGSVSGTAGQYYGGAVQDREVHKTGDGFQDDGSANVGMALGETGFLNVTAEYKHHDNSNVTGADNRGAAGGVPADPYQSRIDGDPESTTYNLEYNAGVDVNGVDFYSFGTYSYRHAKAFENYRTETKIPNGLPAGSDLPNIYPLGFEPAETLTENDYSFTGGVKGDVFGWDFDLSSTYGVDHDDIGNVGGLNIQLYGATGDSLPHVFRTGNLNNSEWTDNLDLKHGYDIGLAAPLSVAVGGEFRYETYQLVAGDPASRFGAGSQANPGFSLTDQHQAWRYSEGVYVDFGTKIIPQWTVDAAGRYEHYNDFGDTQDGKFTTRYDIIPEFGLRGTISNGFRAPSLAQEYFSATNVGPGFASAQLPVNSPGAALLGAQPLKPEVSNNYSVGIVAEPLPHLRVSLDAYQIDIRNRIVDTGLFFGNSVLDAIQLNGNQVEPGDNVSAQFYANALNTHTRGVEFSAAYPQDYGDFGEVNYSITANYNNTIAVVSAARAAQYFADGSLPSATSYLTTGAPHEKIILDGFWTNDPWDINLRGTFYGRSSTIDPNEATGAYLLDKIAQAFIVDLEFGYTLDNWHFAAGANNLLDHYPNRVNFNATSPHTEVYNSNSPYGYNGGYYYTRVTYSFPEPSAPAPMAEPPAAPPAPVPPPAPPAPVVEPKREFQVFFDFDKSDITAAAASVIAAAAESVKQGHVTTLTVTGHTDTVGSAKYNLGLSERRATAVKGQLVTDGVAAGEITTIGVGKAGLLVPTKDGVREPQNRRAVIVLQ